MLMSLRKRTTTAPSSFSLFKLYRSGLRSSHDPEAAFFINMGDLVDNGEQYSQWRSWFRGASGLLPQIPVAPISGNHENYSLQWKPYRGDLYLNLFDLPLNGPDGLQKQAYSYDYGAPTRFSISYHWRPDRAPASSPDLRSVQAATRLMTAS